MTLPGKLCIGILEEDNPLRSYFRFKPLLVDEDGRYIPFDEWDRYPDEGCIRIVPDKNESYYFKARMRQNGLFCVVDLREHPGESDKIRPNKNYHPGGDEINGCIVYSDVVRAPVPNMIYQVLPAESAGAIVPVPHTPSVLLRQDGALQPVLHGWEALEATAGMALMKATEACCPVEKLQVFDLPGFRGETVSFAIRPASDMAAVCDVPERPPRHGAGEAAAHPEAQETPEKRESRPAEARKEHRPADAPKAQEATKPAKAPDAQKVQDTPAAPAAAVEEAPTAPEIPATSEVTPTQPAPKPETPQEKPWLHHDASMRPAPVDRRLSRAEQLMAAQAGLNPRRGRSLQELIDEKWTHSRLNQLGMPVSPIATGAPVANPVDAAVDMLKSVWDQPQMRKPLMEALARTGSLGEAVSVQRETAQKASADAELNELEAQRLELMGELERLKAGGQQIREKLKQEILKNADGELAECAAKVQAAQAEQRRFEQQAKDAQAASRDARALLDTLAGEQLEQKIRDVALTQRVAERLEALKAASVAPAAPEAEVIDVPALMKRLEARAEAEGWALDTFEIANLCVCFALDPVMTLSGPTGSGKTTAAKLLADALGARLAICPPGKGSLRQEARIAEWINAPEASTLLVLDDANLAPSPDPLRGMNPLPGPEWRVIATLQDDHSGLPVTATLLDRGFMVRLSMPEDLPWQPAVRRAAEAFAPASISGLEESLPQVELPEALTTRMALLRRKLKALGIVPSRRALDDTWRYCSAMLALLGEDCADRAFDCAVAQRLLPTALATAPVEALARLRGILKDLPRCLALLDQPLSIAI